MKILEDSITVDSGWHHFMVSRLGWKTQQDDAWVALIEGMVFDNAFVQRNAIIQENAKVYGNANIGGDAMICDPSIR